MRGRARKHSLARTLLAGAAAGAAGTTALDVLSYLDMAVRGRPPSEVPAETASRLADAIGVGFGDETVAPDRASGVGALLGTVLGVSVAVGYAFLRRAVPCRIPLLPAAVATGAAAMAASDIPAVATGATKPRTWGAAGWISDALPHLAYGLVTVATFDAMTDR